MSCVARARASTRPDSGATPAASRSSSACERSRASTASRRRSGRARSPSPPATRTVRRVDSLEEADVVGCCRTVITRSCDVTPAGDSGNNATMRSRAANLSTGPGRVALLAYDTVCDVRVLRCAARSSDASSRRVRVNRGTTSSIAGDVPTVRFDNGLHAARAGHARRRPGAPTRSCCHRAMTRGRSRTRRLPTMRRAHARGARIVSLCTGAFVLARTGLLDGRRAVTHWADCARFEAQFPTVTLDPGVLYVDDGDILTSAGSAASIDLCLHIVRTDLGRRGREPAGAATRRPTAPRRRSGAVHRRADPDHGGGRTVRGHPVLDDRASRRGTRQSPISPRGRRSARAASPVTSPRPPDRRRTDGCCGNASSRPSGCSRAPTWRSTSWPNGSGSATRRTCASTSGARSGRARRPTVARSGPSSRFTDRVRPGASD